MGIFSKFESTVQGIVEGSFGRVFRAKVQPVEIANKLARAMEANLQLTSDRKIAPNGYDVYLSPRDYAQFQPIERTVQENLADSLINVARSRGYMLVSRPRVLLYEDASLITGQTRISTQFLDARAIAGQNAPVVDEGIESTRSMSPSEARELAAQMAEQASRTEPLPPAWITPWRPTQGKPMQITNPVLHIGRHVSNDVVVNDRRVSRHHAEIRFEHGQFVLYDLGSTNGVAVNGVTTRNPVPLKNNDVVTVGSHEFVFQRR